MTSEHTRRLLSPLLSPSNRWSTTHSIRSRAISPPQVRINLSVSSTSQFITRHPSAQLTRKFIFLKSSHKSRNPISHMLHTRWTPSNWPQVTQATAKLWVFILRVQFKCKIQRPHQGSIILTRVDQSLPLRMEKMGLKPQWEETASTMTMRALKRFSQTRVSPKSRPQSQITQVKSQRVRLPLHQLLKKFPKPSRRLWRSPKLKQWSQPQKLTVRI